MKNEYEIRGDITVIFGTDKDGNVLEILIDTEDLPRVSAISGSWIPYWREDCQTYYVRGCDGSKKYWLHRLIMNFPKGKQVDHFDHNGIKNIKDNLRIATPSQNAQNRRKCQKNNNTSMVRGVSKSSRDGFWIAQIHINGKHIFLGNFNTAEEAEKIVCEARALLMPFSKEASMPSEISEELIKQLLNRRASIRNKGSGIRGVYLKRQTGRWYAQMVVNYKTIHLGTYDTKEEAEKARIDFEKSLKNKMEAI